MPNITELMRVARECAADRCKLLRGCKKELGNLAENLDEIKRLLDQASTNIVSDKSLEDLWHLKDVVHDAEEVLDQFLLEIKETNGLINGMKSGYNKVSSPLSKQLVKVLKNLGETRQKAMNLQHHQPSQSSVLRKAETGHVPVRDRSSFLGYDNEYEQLVSMLVQQHGNKDTMSKDRQIIAIVGHGGMGKTELARQAFRDVKGEFDLPIWVHAYGKKSERELLEEIWNSVPGDKPVRDMNLSCLQWELEKLLASKRCLLVLDDVWNHERASSEVEREEAGAALDSFMRFGKQGSRIVMTSRAKICSTTLSADATIVLDGIKPEKMITLLLKVSDTANLMTDCSMIQELLKKQVPKLKGSPLAALEIADELKQDTTSSKWCQILLHIEQHLGNVLSSHLFTYRHLPPHLQRCFGFCSIFPNNWRFEPEKLTKMWVALGFVEESTQQGPSMEDVATGYFDILVRHSLFQQVESGGRGRTYVIHEQIHWMIRLASHKNCVSISATGGHNAATISIPTTVRHLSVTSSCFDQLKKCDSTVLNKVRTLLILKNGDGVDGDKTIDKGILKKFKGVRVLDLTQTGLTQLPGTIGKLKHVRYLGLPSTMRTLCDQLTELLFLQTFSVSTDEGRREHSCQLQKFPTSMSSLINMRHLDINTDCITNISGIGTMVKLQGSIVFRAMRASEKEGHGMSELARMTSLSGTLSIKGLDAVASKEEATAAQLASKGSVKVLKLEWGPPDPRQVNEGPTDPASAVLEGLQPHRYLQDLHITRYPGESSPTWLGGLEMLTRLYLKNCRKLKALPALGALPCLELLDIKELTVVERIDRGLCGSSGPEELVAFRNLKKMVLDDMPELVAWDDMPKGAFPRLSDISIIDCPKLSSLSGLQWFRCDQLRVKGCPAITPEILHATFSVHASTCKFY